IEQVSEALDLFLQRQGTTLEDLAEFRQEIEGSAVARAGQRATAAEIGALGGMVDELRELNSRGESAWRDVVVKEVHLHQALVALSHNTVSSAVLYAINTTMERAFDCLPYGHGDRIVHDWEQITAALRDGRFADAEAALHEHISFFNQTAIGEAQSEKRGEFAGLR
ncbi:MAG: FadR/GntR family transcriptional regulator, partial [Anaerolineae bacterium]